VFAIAPRSAQPLRSKYPRIVGRKLLPKLLPLSLCLLALSSSAAAQADKAPILEPGPGVERELGGRQAHSYWIDLTSGQFIHVVVDQRGVDVVVTLFSPDGKQIIEVDSPNGTHGLEPVLAIADTSGSYRLDVRSLEKEAPIGRYQVKIEVLRTATTRDKTQIAAERAFMQAERLRTQGTGESLRAALIKYEEALPIYRAIGNRSGEATSLNNIGLVYHSLGRKQEALSYYGLALQLYRFVRNRRGEAETLNNIGGVYDSLGQKQKAFDHYGQALTLSRAVGDRIGEATTLSNMGSVLDDLGEKKKALDYYRQALPLSRSIGDRSGELATLSNIGGVYDDLGLKQLALAYYEQALTILLAVGDRTGEATLLINIGGIFFSSGEKQTAFEYFIRALALKRAVGDRDGEASALTNIGSVYHSLGEKQKGLDYYKRALRIYRAVRDPSGEAATLMSVGFTYASIGEKHKALAYYQHAVPVYRRVGDHDGEATALNNIGLVYGSLGKKQKALDYCSKALRLRRIFEDRGGEGQTLVSLGLIYSFIGKTRQAVDCFAGALPLASAVGDRDGEATTLNNLMSGYESLGIHRLSIFYGKESLNIYQRLRSRIKGVTKDVQMLYLKTVEQSYRDLAELLIRQGRFAEAQQVLNAFKDEQFFDFDQAESRQLRPLTRTPREEEFALRLNKLVSSMSALGNQVVELKYRVDNQPNRENNQQLNQLRTQLTIASNEFSAFLKQAEAEFSKPTDDKDKIDLVSDTIEMRAALRQLNQETGQNAVAIYTMVGETSLHVLIISPDGITSVSSMIRGTELDQKARQLWALLRSADYDLRTLSYELYKSIFKPIEDSLPKGTKTIMWSLDRRLRYLPMAALYDGNQYLVERYNHVIFTRADNERLTRSVTPEWAAYGFSSSAPHTVKIGGTTVNFKPLYFAKDEMEIFRTQIQSKGILDGDVFLEAQFTKASLLATLKKKRPVVHISSHFRFVPGDESRTFLLLGDGQVMTLSELKSQLGLFQEVQLLTLSACDTAAQRPDANGREVDGFAELAQRLGAGAVLASLWAVNENSTTQLMKGFYARRQGGKYTKAEALRQTQLDLLYGSSGTSALPNAIPKPEVAITKGNRSSDEEIGVESKYRIPFTVDRNKPFAHPYYWSPFVLFGNWK
jgi:CHAT domain-containing protein/Tfp pilus assembly protein PilF